MTTLNNLEIDLTHSGHIYPVALPQTQVRFVPDRIDNPRFDLETVDQSVPDSVTLPLLCESSDKSIADSGSIPLSAAPPQHFTVPTNLAPIAAPLQKSTSL